MVSWVTMNEMHGSDKQFTCRVETLKLTRSLHSQQQYAQPGGLDESLGLLIWSVNGLLSRETANTPAHSRAMTQKFV